MYKRREYSLYYFQHITFACFSISFPLASLLNECICIHCEWIYKCVCTCALSVIPSLFILQSHSFALSHIMEYSMVYVYQLIQFTATDFGICMHRILESEIRKPTILHIHNIHVYCTLYNTVYVYRDTNVRAQNIT